MDVPEHMTRKATQLSCLESIIPEQYAKKNDFDREYIIPRLGITGDTHILDIGCGVGRIAEMILPLTG